MSQMEKSPELPYSNFDGEENGVRPCVDVSREKETKERNNHMGIARRKRRKREGSGEKGGAISACQAEREGRCAATVECEEKEISICKAAS
eukprot:2455215-Amphidinium_carterae.1